MADERLNLATAMRYGLEQNEFSVVYQPKFNPQREMVGVEFLTNLEKAPAGGYFLFAAGLKPNPASRAG